MKNGRIKSISLYIFITLSVLWGSLSVWGSLYTLTGIATVKCSRDREIVLRSPTPSNLVVGSPSEVPVGGHSRQEDPASLLLPRLVPCAEVNSAFFALPPSS